MKRAQGGVYHKISPKHLDRYVREFAGKHNLREFDTLNQMRRVVLNLVGVRVINHIMVAEAPTFVSLSQRGEW